MDGLTKMDNSIDDIRNALLVFLDEAVGFRKSLHHLHRWYETKDYGELENLVVEIGIENHVDMWPILHAVNTEALNSSLSTINYQISAKGLYIPSEWEPGGAERKTTPLPINFFNKAENPSNSFYELTSAIWQTRDWVEHNYETLNVNPISCIAMAQQYIIEAKKDFTNVFRLMEMLFGYNTIASCLLQNDIESFTRMLGTYYPTKACFITALGQAIDYDKTLNWIDALSRNQVKSKLWLLEEIKQLPQYKTATKIGNIPVNTVVVGGWVGLLPFLAQLSGFNIDNVTNVDIDVSVHYPAAILNTGFCKTFKNSSLDIRKFNFDKYKNLVVIDTIVEHFENHGEWVKTLPTGTTVVLQGNDMFDVPDHVNCHNSLNEFLEHCGLNTILWSGELLLHKCTRFMAIGKV
jgi:hypothetical protein